MLTSPKEDQKKEHSASLTGVLGQSRGRALLGVSGYCGFCGQYSQFLIGSLILELGIKANVLLPFKEEGSNRRRILEGRGSASWPGIW